MAEILIRNGDAEAAAIDLAAAIQEIFAVEPLRSSRAAPHTPGTRVLVEATLIALALPPAVIGTADILARAHLGEKLRRLIGKATALRKTTRAAILIDPGDGKPIPLEEANRETILTALQAVEQRLRR
jgi:hypothetical protein